MAKILLGVAAVVVLGVGVWAFTQTGNNDGGDTSSRAETSQSSDQTNGDRQAQNNEQPSEHAVAFTNEGFSPETITIEQGETVTWTNKSQEKMWVASSVHPTHNQLPGFDQREGVDEGASYSYQFQKKGEWSYHNHLRPSDKGTVIVE
ncbi:hypothetical protein BRC19_03110 [Candidatus Saccharibacteria bacterium QS_5_54_17]|nr:MAG: hypothetical protein BRC19_03110 [Candidatus Saccharibacteria bacterium QS_5_54_17]